jgi:hypothetical protein
LCRRTTHHGRSPGTCTGNECSAVNRHMWFAPVILLEQLSVQSWLFRHTVCPHEMCSPPLDRSTQFQTGWQLIYRQTILYHAVSNTRVDQKGDRKPLVGH